MLSQKKEYLQIQNDMMPKRFCLLIATLMSSVFNVEAQVTDEMYSIKNDAVVVEKVIPFDVSKDMASAAVKSYFLTTLNDSNVTLKNSSDDYYVAKITTPKLTRHSMGNWYTQGFLTIDVKFKENRMKVSVSCSDVLNTNSDFSIQVHYSPVEASPINPKHDAWKLNILKKYADETFNNLVAYMVLIVEELNTAVQNAKEEEDW